VGGRKLLHRALARLDRDTFLTPAQECNGGKGRFEEKENKVNKEEQKENVDIDKKRRKW
jgi:hypothetical protein